jgi:hypothetical protein
MKKVNILSKVDQVTNQNIIDYQNAYQRRFGQKLSKSDAIADIVNMGCSIAVDQIKEWDKELETFLKTK